MQNSAKLRGGKARWKLWRPMLVVSVAVHAGLLTLPLPSETQSPPEPEPEETVKITSLVAPNSAPVEQPPAPAAAPAPQPVAPAVPPVEPPVPLAEEPVPEAPPDEPPEEQPPEKAAAPTPNSSSAPPGANLVEALRPRILDRLAKSSNDLGEMENFLNSFPTESMRAEQIPSFFAGDQLREGAIASVAIPQTNAFGAYTDYLEPVLTNQFGFSLEPLPSYGGADLYRAQNAEGVEFYMSLVKLKLGSGAFVVFWQSDPRANTN